MLLNVLDQHFLLRFWSCLFVKCKLGFRLIKGEPSTEMSLYAGTQFNGRSRSDWDEGAAVGLLMFSMENPGILNK